MWRELRILVVHTGLRQEALKERGHLEDTGIDGCVILKGILEKYNKRSCLDYYLVLIKNDAS